jgi:hypothetical protein
MFPGKECDLVSKGWPEGDYWIMFPGKECDLVSKGWPEGDYWIRASAQ